MREQCETNKFQTLPWEGSLLTCWQSDPKSPPSSHSLLQRQRLILEPTWCRAQKLWQKWRLKGEWGNPGATKGCSSLQSSSGTSLCSRGSRQLCTQGPVWRETKTQLGVAVELQNLFQSYPAFLPQVKLFNSTGQSHFWLLSQNKARTKALNHFIIPVLINYLKKILTA